MNVLLDYHHSDLLESLYRLFEDRIGARVYVPRGLEWFSEGVWQFGAQHAGDALARQFLLAAERDELQPDRDIHWTTFAEAQAMDWDVVVASVPDNERGYGEFARSKGARFAVEVGNVNQPVYTPDAIILDSTGQYPGGTAFTPEFDYRGAFRYSEPPTTRAVMSFVNLFPALPCYGSFLETAERLPETWRARIHGHNTPDGFVKPTAAIGDLMAESRWGWHDKISGDGFGYVIHYWASVGRPLIGHARHYARQRAEWMWEDGVTCIDLDKHSPTEVATLMNEIVSDPARHEEMCTTIAQRLRERIDWPAEAERVGRALGLMVTA